MRLGLFTDALPERRLADALEWLAEAVPEVRDLEVGVGGYSPAPHLDGIEEAAANGYRVSALNASGNPLEDPVHDAALREAITLARELGIERVVCMSGGDPKLSGGGWFPGIEDAVDAYWDERVLPYWEELARLEGVRLCLELEPGAAVYNVSTFERLAELGPSLAVNLDPSHLFWQGIDPIVAVRRLGDRVGWAHGKDTTLDPERMPVDGGLDRRAWRYTTVGRGHDLDWWGRFLDALAETGYDGVVSIEYEDELVQPEESVLESARFLGRALGRVSA